MSEFFWGMLALPLLAGAVALAVGAILWGWKLLEDWREGRFAKLEKVRLAKPHPIGKTNLWTLPDLGIRGLIAANIMTRPHAFLFQPLRGVGIVFIGGRPDTKLTHLFSRSLDKAVLAVQEEAAGD